MLETLKNTIKNLLFSPWWTLSYRGKKLKFKVCPRIGKCSVCGRKGYTNIHHTCYNFTVKEVMANNALALLFTFECCFQCHQLANAIRKLFESDPDFSMKTTDKKLQKIIDFHQKLLAERKSYNKKHVKP